MKKYWGTRESKQDQGKQKRSCFLITQPKSQHCMMSQSMPSSKGARAREAYLEQHKAQMQAALAKAVNAALLAAQSDDPIAFVAKQLLQREQREAQTTKAQTAELEVCRLMTKDGNVYTGKFATTRDAEKGDLTAEMQLVHASGVDPANILACWCITGGDVDPSMFTTWRRAAR